MSLTLYLFHTAIEKVFKAFHLEWRLLPHYLAFCTALALWCLLLFVLRGCRVFSLKFLNHFFTALLHIWQCINNGFCVYGILVLLTRWHLISLLIDWLAAMWANIKLCANFFIGISQIIFFNNDNPIQIQRVQKTAIDGNRIHMSPLLIEKLLPLHKRFTCI